MESNEYGVMFRVEETHWWYRALHRLVFDSLNAELPDWRNKTILDAGCGTGAILQRLGNPERNVGVDLAPEAISFCRERGLTNVQQADINALPFAEASFDAVICSSVLCHQWIKNVGAAIGELHRVLRPGGLLFLNLPAFSFLGSHHDKAVMTAHRFRKSEVQSFLIENGFVIRRLTYWTTLLFPLAVVARTLGVSKTGRDFDSAARPITDGLFTAVMTLELGLLRKMTLPFGIDLFAIAQKQV